MDNTQKFNLDLSAPVGPLVLYAMQADSMSRFFAITVTDNGAAWTPPDGAAWTVRFGAPGMPAGWYDTITEPGGGTHPAVVVDENTATVEIAEQAVSTPGNNVLCVLVTDAQGYQIASWPFLLNVQGVPGFDAPEATVYYNALTEQVAQVLASAQAAAASATLAESWAVGGTGTREGEDTNNAEYWASEAQRVSQDALGWYETEQALQAAHPTGENGQWAIIGTTDTIWTWDSDTSAWVDSGAQMDLSNYYTKSEANAAFATAAQGTKADSAVQSVNGPAGPAASVTTRNLAYRVGDTITTSNASFDPNTAIGGTWGKKTQVLYEPQGPTQIALLNGFQADFPASCLYYISPGGICTVSLAGLYGGSNGQNIANIPLPAQECHACNVQGVGTRITTDQSGNFYYTGLEITNHIFATLVYPVSETLGNTYYVWTKTA